MMKKRIIIFLFAMSMALIGCGNGENTNQPSQEVETKKETEVAMSEEENRKTQPSQEVETKKETEVEVSEEVNTEKSEIAENTEKENNNSVFNELRGLEFYFSSGAGGWRTIVDIEADGSFSGVYSDSDMGSVGEGYPGGTYYYCEFEGKFTEPVKVNDYTYSMKIEEIHYANEPDTEEIIDEILYHYSLPYGLEGAEEVLLYLPNAPISELPEEYMGWVYNDMEDANVTELPFYGLYNVTEQNGFSSYNYLENYMTSAKLWSDIIKNTLENEELTQTEMNMESQELYAIWDDALNHLWSEVKAGASEEEFTKLLEEQRVWIAEKEKAVEEAGKEVEGGSMYALVVNMKAAELTEERVYELYELLKQ